MAGGRAAIVRDAMGNRLLCRVLVTYFGYNVAETASWVVLLVWGYDRDGVRGASAIALVQLVPCVLLAAPLATLLGRFSLGRALWIGYVAQAAGYAALGLALQLAPGDVVVVGVFAAISAVTVTMTRPVHHALLPAISRTTGDLTAGNAVSGTVEGVGYFVGPLLGGLLLAVWGSGPVVLVLAAAMGAAALLTAPLLAIGTPAALIEGEDGPARGTAAALRTVWREPAARVMSVLALADATLVGLMDVLLVVLALDVLQLSAAGPGVLTSAVGIGAMIGAALTFVLIGRARLAPALLLGSLGAGAAFALSAAMPSATLAFGVILVSGAAKAFYDVSARTFSQRLLPDRMLTALFGLQESFLSAGLMLGALLAPFLVTAFSPRGSLVAAGAVLPVVALLVYRSLRRFDARCVVPLDVLDLLMDVPILAVLRPRIVERLALDARTHSSPAGEVIVRSGDVGCTFYVVARGRVEVQVDGALVRELGPGDWFGEIALLRGVPRTATVTAIQDTDLHLIEQQSFLSAVLAAPPSLSAAEDHAREHYVEREADDTEE